MLCILKCGQFYKGVIQNISVKSAYFLSKYFKFLENISQKPEYNDLIIFHFQAGYLLRRNLTETWKRNNRNQVSSGSSAKYHLDFGFISLYAKCLQRGSSWLDRSPHTRNGQVFKTSGDRPKQFNRQCLFGLVCLFVLGDTLHSRILHSYGDVSITGEGLQILNYIAPLPELDNRCDCHGSSEITIINECPMSQQVWHAKKPSLLNDHNHECLMRRNTNKQTNKNSCLVEPQPV